MYVCSCCCHLTSMLRAFCTAPHIHSLVVNHDALRAHRPRTPMPLRPLERERIGTRSLVSKLRRTRRVYSLILEQQQYVLLSIYRSIYRSHSFSLLP